MNRARIRGPRFGREVSLPLPSAPLTAVVVDRKEDKKEREVKVAMEIKATERDRPGTIITSSTSSSTTASSVLTDSKEKDKDGATSSMGEWLDEVDADVVTR